VSASEPQRAPASGSPQRWGYRLHQQPAFRAIRYADVRYGILPSQSLALTPT